MIHPHAPIIVLELELARPDWAPVKAGDGPGRHVDCSDLDPYAAALVLLRLHGRPVGCLHAPITNGRLSATTVAAAMTRGLRSGLASALARAAVRSRELPDRLELASLTEPPPSPPSHRLPLVTVAVCTRERPDDLARCLETLNRIRYPHLDLLVVDNAPVTTGTADVVRRYPRVRSVCEPRPGLDLARNRAILECRGEILAFTDDDAVVDAAWVDALVQVFEADDSVAVVTGLVLPLELETPAQQFFEQYGGFGRGFRRRWVRARRGRPAGRELAGTGAFGTGANMAFRRTVFDRVGGFDPALDVGTSTNGGGDLEMFFRVLKHGHTLVYEPGALVWHRHRRDYQALRTQIANNGIGLYACLARTAWFYPDERLAMLRFGLWWFARWNVRRLFRRLARREQIPLDLVVAELLGSLKGPFRYGPARRRAEALAAAYAHEPSFDGPARLCPSPDIQIREAVRRVDLAAPLQALSDVTEYRRTHVFVFWRGAPLGRVPIDNHGSAVSALRLEDAIVDWLPAEILGVRRRHTWPEFGRLLSEWLRARAGFTTCGRPPSGGPQGRLKPAGHTCESGSRPAAPAAPAAATSRSARPSPTTVSVVVATRDRPDELRACLESLEAQRTRHRLQVIVVDNHPASGITPGVTERFPRVRLVHEPRAGLSYARNRGILAADGDIIAATDDDVVCPPDWIDQVVAPFDRPEVAVVTGHVLPLELETRAQQLFESYGGLGRGYRPGQVGPEWFQRHRRSVPTWSLGCTANAAFRARIFSDPRIGLFDEALGAGTPTGCSEDTYLFYHVLKAGLSIAYEPRAYVWHRHRRTMDALRHQIYCYSKGHVAYQLTTWLRDHDRRGLVRLLYELPVTYLRRAGLRLLRRSDYPLQLIALEVLGNLAGPWALWRSRRRVRLLGSSARAGVETPLEVRQLA